MLDHEKLDVYQRSIEFLALAVRILKKVPRGNSVLKDQFNRASLSTPLNIAEKGRAKQVKLINSDFTLLPAVQQWSVGLF